MQWRKSHSRQNALAWGWGAEKRMVEFLGVIDESGYAERWSPYILNHKGALRNGKTTVRNHAEVVKVIFKCAENRVSQIGRPIIPLKGPCRGVGSNYRVPSITMTRTITAEEYHQNYLKISTGTCGWAAPE